MKKGNNTPIGFILAGVVVFLLRYVPVFPSELKFIEQNYSLDQGVRSCGTFLGSFSERCSWMEPLNVVIIIAAAALIVYGAYLFYQQKNS